MLRVVGAVHLRSDTQVLTPMMAILNRKHVAALAAALLIALLPATEGDSTYCSLCRNHTMCIYQGDGAACNQVIGGGVTEADAETIVEVHNRLRDQVASGAEQRGNPGPQPPAADMMALVWDNELAMIAQRWADQCTFKHDTCRKVERFAVGQNLHKSSSNGAVGEAKWAAAIEGWYDEVKNFNKDTVDKFQFNGKTGHYSQLVWGDTRYVGCGYKAYTEPNDWKSQIYVCNYGPSGNYQSHPVYAKGESCSECPSGCHSTYTSLCA